MLIKGKKFCINIMLDKSTIMLVLLSAILAVHLYALKYVMEKETPAPSVLKARTIPSPAAPELRARSIPPPTPKLPAQPKRTTSPPLPPPSVETVAKSDDKKCEIQPDI